MSYPVYEPLHDPACTIITDPFDAPRWRGSWLWYPSQLTTHLHTKAMQATVARCCNVSYPGHFRLPCYQLHVRYTGELRHAQLIRWQATPGRARVFVNGHALDFTRRQIDMPAGSISLRWVLDFCTTLPSLIVDADDVCSDATWQVSLDGMTWVTAETAPHYNQPDVLPDAHRDLTVRIPVQTVLRGQYTPNNPTYIPASTSIVVDFGHLELGTIAVTARGPAHLQVVVGESFLEVLSDDVATHEQHAIPMLDLLLSASTVRTPERCVRFARLSSDTPWTIYDLQLEARVAPVVYHGDFRCDDDQLNAIWQAGAATIHACLHDFYLDGLRRDGLPWADQLSEVEGADCVFFDTAAARHSLIALTLPVQPSPADFGIIDQPLFQPLSFWHDWMHRGDLQFLVQHQERLWGVLDVYASLQDEQGLISAARVYAQAPDRDANWNFFPDWAVTEALGPDPRGTPTYAHMQLLCCFTVGAQVADLLGDVPRATEYTHRATQLRATIRREFWDDAQQAFINGFDRYGARDTRLTVYAQVWAILSQLVSTAEAARLVTQVLERSDYRPANRSLNQHWELQAYAQAEKVSAALAVVKRVWGGWLDQGHRRFPEDMRPGASVVDQLSMYGRPFANSLCHGWAGGAVVTFLSRHVLGITALTAGFTSCRVAPQLGHLSWVCGRMPTPHGVIELDWNGHTGTLLLPNMAAQLVGCQTDRGATYVHGPGHFALVAMPSGTHSRE